MSTATTQISHECPPAGELQLEDWDQWGDLLELGCMHESGPFDVLIFGTPVLREVFRGAEFDGFRLDRIVLQCKDHGLPVAVVHATEMDDETRRAWQAEAYAIIDDWESLRSTIEEKHVGQFV